VSSRTRRAGLPALALAAGLLVAGCGAGAEADAGGHDHSAAVASVSSTDDGRYAGLHLTQPYQKPEFTLTDTTGAPYDFGARTGSRPTLLFFGYTHCPDVCPTTMADIALALRKVDPAVAAETSVVFVTTDPARDTPGVLGAYLDQFDADLPTQFTGLTGDQSQIDQAQLAAGVPLAQDMGQTHSALLLLYGTKGEADVAFDAGNTGADIAHDLAVVAAG
jgi:protein SCO1/2